MIPDSPDSMNRSPFYKSAGINVAVAAVYFTTAKLGLRLAFVHPSATAVWPPTGIALVGLLLLGYRAWPGIFIGAFLANLTTAGSVATSIGIAAGNTLEAVAGCYLVERFAGGRAAFDRAQNVLRFAILAGVVSTMISATMGVISLCLGGFSDWSSFRAVWTTWWLGDGAGDVVVAPLLLTWARNRRLRWSWAQEVEAAVLLVLLLVVGQAVFSGAFVFHGRYQALGFLCVPLVIWAAYRFGEREAASATFILSAIAIRNTVHLASSLPVEARNDSLIWVDLFMAVVAVMGLILAAAAKERNRAGERFAQVVESAPYATVAVDPAGKIVLANRQTEKEFGYQRNELIGRPVEVLVPERFRAGHPGQRMGFSAQPSARAMGAGRDLYAVRKDGSEFPAEIGLSPIGTEQGMMVLAAIIDITERKRAEAEIQRLASSDPVTGLANYRRLMEELNSEVLRSKRTNQPIALLMLDLDGLKKINDSHGHLTGTKALCRVADAVRGTCREIDIAARYGGDEFSVILVDTGKADAELVARRILERVAGDGGQPPVTASVGVAIYPEDGETAEALIAAADRRLYAMKSQGGGKVGSLA
jgi:diguanylate cyclase (GGDEF)-like protein/PAS domain S-box-containing protein